MVQAVGIDGGREGMLYRDSGRKDEAVAIEEERVEAEKYE